MSTIHRIDHGHTKYTIIVDRASGSIAVESFDSEGAPCIALSAKRLSNVAMVRFAASAGEFFGTSVRDYITQNVVTWYAIEYAEDSFTPVARSYEVSRAAALALVAQRVGRRVAKVWDDVEAAVIGVPCTL